jgi:hypothetical protein
MCVVAVVAAIVCLLAPAANAQVNEQPDFLPHGILPLVITPPIKGMKLEPALTTMEAIPLTAKETSEIADRASLYNFQKIEYEHLTRRLDTQCGEWGCLYNGHCVKGICHCFPGWKGKHCEEKSRPESLCRGRWLTTRHYACLQTRHTMRRRERKPFYTSSTTTITCPGFQRLYKISSICMSTTRKSCCTKFSALPQARPQQRQRHPRQTLRMQLPVSSKRCQVTPLFPVCDNLPNSPRPLSESFYEKSWSNQEKRRAKRKQARKLAREAIGKRLRQQKPARRVGFVNKSLQSNWPWKIPRRSYLWQIS